MGCLFFIFLNKNFLHLEVYTYDRWQGEVLPREFKEGEPIGSTIRVEVEENYSQPEPLLTEADLIKLMDQHEIGTDATHADHVEKIKERQYCKMTPSDRFVPSVLGMALYHGYSQMDGGRSRDIVKKFCGPELRAAIAFVRQNVISCKNFYNQKYLINS